MCLPMLDQLPPVLDLLPSLHDDTELSLLMAVLTETTREWREELETVPPEAMVRQVSAQGQSIGALLLHIADVEGFWLHEGFSGQPRPSEVTAALLSDATDQYGGVWPVPPQQPLAWYYQQLDTVRAQTVAWVQTLHSAGQEFAHPAIAGKTFTARYLLSHVLTHEAYHGGQAVLLSLLFPPAAAGHMPGTP